MTHIIAYRTKTSILLASDTRVSGITIESNKNESKICFADFGQKTFLLSPFNIGVSFYGIGYFEDLKSNEKLLYPISHFITQFTLGLNETDFIDIKIKKILNNIKRISKWEKCKMEDPDDEEFLCGFLCGFNNNEAFFRRFNTCYNEVTEIDALKIGQCVQKDDLDNLGYSCTYYLEEREDEIEEIRRLMKIKSLECPNEVGGETDILEIFPDGNAKWVNKLSDKLDNNEITTASFSRLIDILNSDEQKNYNLTYYDAN